MSRLLACFLKRYWAAFGHITKEIDSEMERNIQKWEMGGYISGIRPGRERGSKVRQNKLMYDTNPTKVSITLMGNKAQKGLLS